MLNLKILLINKFHYVKGGSETYYFGLAELLKKQGHEVIFFSMKDERNVPCEQEKYFVDNIDFNAPMSKLQMAKAGLKMLYSFEAKKKLEHLIQDENPDIAHLNIFQSQLTGAIVDVLKKHKIPMVYTMHDLKALCPCYTMFTHGKICEKCVSSNYFHCVKNRCMKDSLAKSALAAVESSIYRLDKTYKKLDLIITPSEFYKKKLESAHITNVPIIHMKNFLPEGTEFVSEQIIGEYYLYFGRLSKEKGVHTLLKAYKKSRIKNPLYIVGTGPIENELKIRIKKMGLVDNVKMLGFKTGEELNNLVKNCMCVILPSEWYENGPYTIMEAQAAGKPCIVSNNGGLPEIVINEKNGFVAEATVESLCKAIDKMSRLSSQSKWKFGESAVAYAENTYNSKTYWNSLSKWYDKILGI